MEPKMKSNLFGGLCLASIIVTITTHCVGFEPVHNPKNPTNVTNHREDVEQSLYDLRGTKEATSLQAVGFKGCHWCDVLKHDTLEPLEKEGYDVKYVDKSQWTGPKPSRYPTLYYFDGNGKLLPKLTQTGFQSVEKVKEHLRK